MSLLSTKGFRQIDQETDQTILLRAGGNALSTYSQAVVLLGKTEPTAELIGSVVSCEDQKDNRLVMFRIKVVPGTILVGDVEVEITIPALETRINETISVGTFYEDSFSASADTLLSYSEIFVKVTGINSNNVEVSYNFTLHFVPQTNCDAPVITCVSNSSQIVFEYTSLVPPFTVKLNNNPVKVFQSLSSLVQYLNDNGIIINFYKEIEV